MCSFMNHFSKKSLIFYACAIGSVLVLFSGVSRYGRANLSAPSLIDGAYVLDIDANQECPNPEPLLLKVQQSGIYVNAALVSVKNAERSDFVAPLTLDGQWQAPELKLAGKAAPGLEVCGQVVGRVAIATQYQSETFTGELTFPELRDPLVFRSTQEQIGE
jgi:hypothetical protein